MSLCKTSFFFNEFLAPGFESTYPQCWSWCRPPPRPLAPADPGAGRGRAQGSWEGLPLLRDGLEEHPGPLAQPLPLGRAAGLPREVQVNLLQSLEEVPGCSEDSTRPFKSGASVSPWSLLSLVWGSKGEDSVSGPLRDAKRGSGEARSESGAEILPPKETSTELWPFDASAGSLGGYSISSSFSS